MHIMKYITKFLLMGIVAVAGLLSACTSSDDFEPGPKDSGAQVYFPNTIPSEFNVGDDESSVTIPVRRVVTDEALTVNILPSIEQDQEGILNIPSSVSFEAGSDLANLVITFNRSALVDGTEYKASLFLNDEQNLTKYGNNMIDITIFPWPWEELGTGKYRDGWLCGLFEGNLVELDVTIHKHKSQEGVYMVEEMFGWTFMTEFFGATQSQLSGQFSYTPTNITIDCSDPANVKIAKQYTGITEGIKNYGDFLIESAAPGTFVNGVITFPEDGINAYMTGYSSNPLPTNPDGTFRIMLPGAEITDYTLTAAYGGMLVNSDNSSASAVIDFTYGADVTGINYIIAEGDVEASAATLAAQIANGTAENILSVEEFTAGAGSVSIKADLTTPGPYTVVALPLDKENKPLESNAAAASFYFPGMDGGDIPDCDVEAMMGSVSENKPDALEKNPDESSLYFKISGSELKTLHLLAMSTSNIETLVAQGASYEEIIASYGEDFSSIAVPTINETGYYENIWINLNENTSYTMLVQATNIYGRSKVLAVEKSTAAVDTSWYTGELAIGKYDMVYQSVEDGETITSSCTFTVNPVKGSENEFTIKDLGLNNTTSWYASYDSATHKFTVSGVEVGYEDLGSRFGQGWGYYDQAGTMILGFFSFANEQSNGTDPCVFSVDATTGQINQLETLLQVLVADAASGKILGYLTQYLPGETVITYAENASSSAVQPSSKQAIRHTATAKYMKATDRFSDHVATAKCAEMPKSAAHSGVRTLDVKTAKCEPLPAKPYNGKAKISKKAIHSPLM
ncbi:hypothetical protein [uncultured Alistipes sp.]|uniref:hypothetical protein n=1 Tax=uncultured Alistipes sp. TaxID=538949 RepID=UPI00280393E2|nr:hypothetical protein [uncultured Alistipes sp.]